MEEIEESLALKYGLKRGLTLSRIEAGFLSENYKVRTDEGDFFLKRYRFEDKEKIEEIHRVKRYFSSKGIPVILPIRTRTGSTYFSLGTRHFALFPFVMGRHYDRGTMPPQVIETLGAFAARLHRAGAECDFTTKESMADRIADAFLTEARQIIGIIRTIERKSPFDELALESLLLKIQLVERDSQPVIGPAIGKPILLQGDLQEQNIFFDEAGQVKWIFDFEKAVTGYRSFELWRSVDYMFINGDFSDKRVGDAVLFLKAYHRENPIGEAELMAGLDFYYQRLIHSLWVEKEHYLKHSARTDHFLENRSIRYLSENMPAFKERIKSGIYRQI